MLNVKKLKAVFKEAKELGERKNADYHKDSGPDNIGDMGLDGISVRLYDKVCRLYSLTRKTDDPNFESIRDTLLDIVNYSAYGVMIQDKEWT